MERRNVRDAELTQEEKTALDTIQELMDYVNTHEFSKEAKDAFTKQMISNEFGMSAIQAMSNKYVLTQDESDYLIGCLTLLVRSGAN